MTEIAERAENDRRPASGEYLDGRDRLPAGLRVVYLGPDITDSATFRRCEAWHRLGVVVRSFTFERAAGTVDRATDWSHTPLGPMPYGLGPGRLKALARAFRTLDRNRDAFAADIVWARNLDLGLFALARRRAGTKLVYEVLDIHPALTRGDVVGAIFRWLERRLLARVDLVVVSSPAFAEAYFRTRTPYRGPTFLLENKVCIKLDHFSEEVLAAVRHGPSDTGVLRIGVVGRLRCGRSLELLGAALDRCLRPLQIHVFGYPETHVEEAFAALRARGDAVVWHGRFAYPDDLPEVYGQLDLAWDVVFDELQPLNGRWLLPNRIYEGGLFAVPAIALAGTETGRWIDEVGGGWLLPEGNPDELVTLLDGLDRTALDRVRQHLTTVPRTRFIDGYADHAAALATLLPTALPEHETGEG